MSLLSRIAVEAARGFGMLARTGSPTNVSASYLVVAGGGGGGLDTGGGGGAGGYLNSTATLSLLTTYTVTVGAGGTAGTADRGGNGADSVLSGTGLTTITSIGGGGGGGRTTLAGLSGGSGGGADGATALNSGGSGTSGQGFAGGNSAPSGTTAGGAGGGGASAVGTSATTGNAAGSAGGAGSSSSISGSSVTYAGGGGGGSASGGAVGAGGAGGGGNGGGSSGLGAIAGTTNTGGGGGGGYGVSSPNRNGAAGGSGIVIISYTSATPKFVGGTLTTLGGNQIHTFTSSGTLSPITPITASYLVVAGGGGGGSSISSGGGGAGGLLTSSTTLYLGATYVITVGTGGAGGVSSANGSNGSNSSIAGTGLTTVTSTGGGGGGGNSGGGIGSNGGSGGGGYVNAAGGSGTSGQGNNGGSGGAFSVPYPSGGGGGSGAVGGTGSGSQSGAGGAGTSSLISGSSVTYAGGGGGGSNSSYPTLINGSGGTGGGGAGGTGGGTAPIAGTINTGGGGGGAAANLGAGASGGSGIVIISYAGSQAFNGGLVTSSGGNTIHTFTSTGALTPLTNNLNNSLRFRSSASAYLSRTPTVAGNQTTWTWSAWVKRGTLGVQQKLFTAGSSGSLFASFEFIAGDNLQFYAYNGSTNAYLVTTQVFRDPSAWYHIVWAIDTTQATAANRMQLFINGNQVTSFSTSTYPSQNFAFPINNNVIHNIGRDNINVTNYLDGYMADINFIDGQQLQPYYFGNNDANFVWKPILYKGTYGTNGFYLTFGNTTSTTTLGYDSSPNGNNWTTNNISLTAGTTYDAMTDVPTNTSATVANYCVLNALDNSGSSTVSDANLTFSRGAAHGMIRCGMALPSSGKYYFEQTIQSNTSGSSGVGFGLAAFSSSETGVTPAGAYGLYGYIALNYIDNNGTQSQIFSVSYNAGVVLQVAADCDNGKMWFGVNNVWSDGTTTGTTGNPSGGTNPTITASPIGLFPYGRAYANGGYLNFGQRPFTYTPPTGFVALNTFNLPTSTVVKGNTVMDATLYTGDSSYPRSFTNQAQFKPDLVWTKARNNTYSHVLYDSVRGTGTGAALFSDLTSAEGSNSGNVNLTSFNSNGWTVGSTSSTNILNNNTMTFVGWQWQAGQGSTSSNTSGSITSTVSVNATAGFSVVTYTNTTGSSFTVGHGLGVAPAMIIIKLRNAANNWNIYHKSLGAGNYITLNTTAASTASATLWNNTAPTSSVFSLGSDWNLPTYTSVAYCWAAISGFSAFGSYTGNGSSDGVFVYTGFLPRFVMLKNYSSGGSWVIHDTARDTYNVTNKTLYPNYSNAESTPDAPFDILSNGFKLRSATLNDSGAGFIYAAFAANPFRNSNAF